VGKEEERKLGRSKHRWEDTIKMELIECEFMDWIYLAQDKASGEPLRRWQ
jgi:hypothetical protein